MGSEAAGTFTMPDHGIMCFHCGEVFTSYSGAQGHFGATPDAEPGCLIDRVAIEGSSGTPERGQGLLIALRKAEAERDHLEVRVTALLSQLAGLQQAEGELRRYFGTTSAWAIHDRLSNAEFRAEHAVSLLDAHGIPFDSEEGE